jgi:4a-hydroxytetrahydrobiopterin dehydratase
VSVPVGWGVVGQSLGTYFRTGSVAAGARLTTAIAELAEIDAAYPAIDVRRDGVAVRLFGFPPAPPGPHLELAARISAVAESLGATADPAAVQNLVIGIDALDPAAVLPFWQAVLGYLPRTDDTELVDPHQRGPVVYVNRMDAPRPQRNRVHVDVFVPLDQAESRVAAALAASGRLVTDAFAPSWWVLADPEGNEACVATGAPLAQ